MEAYVGTESMDLSLSPSLSFILILIVYFSLSLKKKEYNFLNVWSDRANELGLIKVS